MEKLNIWVFLSAVKGGEFLPILNLNLAHLRNFLGYILSIMMGVFSSKLLAKNLPILSRTQNVLLNPQKTVRTYSITVTKHCLLNSLFVKQEKTWAGVGF